MTDIITKLDDRFYKIELDYNDENVDLTVATTVGGDKQSAQGYVRHFDADTRQQYRYMFPVLVKEVEDEIY